jgi:hypothetical protein
MNKVNFFNILRELCDSEEEANNYYEASQVMVDEHGQTTRDAAMRELVIMFTPNAAYEQIAALASASVQVDDEMLAKRLEAIIYNIERRLEGQKPAPISVTDRLGDNDEGVDILKIGELASKYHFEEYGCYPEKIAKRIGNKIMLVNRYTSETAPTTLDRAIKELTSLYFPFC